MDVARVCLVWQSASVLLMCCQSSQPDTVLWGCLLLGDRCLARVTSEVEVAAGFCRVRVRSCGGRCSAVGAEARLYVAQVEDRYGLRKWVSVPLIRSEALREAPEDAARKIRPVLNPRAPEAILQRLPQISTS